MRVASPRLKFAKNIAVSSQRCSTEAIRVATRTHSAIATVPQMASAISIGITSATACGDAAGWRHRTTANVRCSFAQSLPEFRQALDRRRDRGAQLLREERNTQFLDQPAELLELRRDRALPQARSKLPQVRLLDGRQLHGQARIARRVGAQLVEAQ